MRKLVTILKYSFVLIVILLFSAKKPTQIPLFHSMRFTDDVFAGQSDDKKVYVLDIGKLEKVQELLTKDKNDITGFPEEILALNGKKVKLAGYLLIPYDAYISDGSIDNFMVGKNAYGCPCCDWGSSPPPTVFNTVVVALKKGESLKPPFAPLVEVTGTFFAHQEYYIADDGKKHLASLFSIQDADARKKRKLF
jgi:hypothetical protein